MRGPRLGPLQARIVEIIAEKGQATAREITEALNREQPVAHSTVQTLLRQIEAKGAVTHVRRDRTFLFKPVAPPDGELRTALREVVDRHFGGSTAELVLHLLDTGRVSDEERARIRARLDAPER